MVRIGEGDFNATDLMMAKIGLLHSVIIAETIWCIYRKFSSFSTRAKALAIFRGIAETVLILFFFCVSVSHFFVLESGNHINNFNVIFETCFHFWTINNSIYCIWRGIYNSNEFRTFIASLESIHVRLFYDAEYRVSFKKLTHECYTLLLFVTLFCIGIIIKGLIDFNSDFNDINITNPFRRLFVPIFVVWTQCRFILECHVFIILILLFYISLQQIHRCTNLVITVVKSKGHQGGEINYEKLCRKLRDKVIIAQNLKVYCDQLKTCFGTQVLSSLFAAYIYLIFLMYMGVNGIMTPAGRDQIENRKLNALFLLTNYTVVIVAMMYAGQKAQNEADKVTRALARLHCLLVTIPGSEAMALRRCVKALRRQLVVAPVRVRLLAPLRVRMALLPDILAAVVAHTILLLQFNHVV